MASGSMSNNNQQNGKFLPSDVHVLQKHAFFFDRNEDGIVYPWETFKGMRALGFGILLSAATAILVNGLLSQKTRPGKFPSLLFPIEIKNIKKGKHGSDTDVYDTEGRFVPEKFEEIFKKHARSHPNALTSDELTAMLKANREPKNYAGWFVAYAEWKLLYSLCKDKNGLLHKESMRAVYDGSIFYQLEKERESTKKKVDV